MRKLAIAFGLLAASCGQDNTHTSFRYHDDGRVKPAVAIASMIDTTSFDAPWSISEELTSMVIKHIAGQGSVFVQSKEEYPIAENPFTQDISWIKRDFNNQEFVLFMELVEHEIVPAKGKSIPHNLAPQEISTSLNMGVRVRLVDVRGVKPRIVLQELVRDSYFIPKSLMAPDYSQIVWGTNEYRKSPMGIAHTQIVQQIAERVSDYIMLAKNQ